MDNKNTILYVDDEPINLMLFQLNMEENYSVLTAEDGLHGLKVLQDHPEIKVIISDMKMPNMNGIEFITEAKKTFPNKKYFILTGFEITEEIQAAMDKGDIVKYLRKPFNIEEIESSIEQAMD